MKLSTHSTYTGSTGRSCSQYTFFVTQKFAQAFSSISLGMLVIPRRNWKLRLCNFYCGEYPGYQRFFLACDGELRFVGHRPTRVRPKAEDTRGEAFRAGHFLTETGYRTWKASGTQGMWWGEANKCYKRCGNGELVVACLRTNSASLSGCIHKFFDLTLNNSTLQNEINTF